jgi:hypothetical protein
VLLALREVPVQLSDVPAASMMSPTSPVAPELTTGQLPLNMCNPTACAQVSRQRLHLLLVV